MTVNLHKAEPHMQARTVKTNDEAACVKNDEIFIAIDGETIQEPPPQ